MNLSMTTRIRSLEKSIVAKNQELNETKADLKNERDARIEAERQLEEAEQRIITLTSN